MLFFFFLSKIVIEISKYRVLLDMKTEEMNNNNALLTKTQEEFHNAVTKLAQIELVTYNKQFNYRNTLIPIDIFNTNIKINFRTLRVMWKMREKNLKWSMIA